VDPRSLSRFIYLAVAIIGLVLAYVAIRALFA
jgi:hypothetical protein